MMPIIIIVVIAVGLLSCQTQSFAQLALDNVYVLNQGSNTVSIINGTSNKIIDTIPVGIHPASADGSSDLSRLYVINQASNTD